MDIATLFLFLLILAVLLAVMCVLCFIADEIIDPWLDDHDDELPAFLKDQAS